MGIESVTGVLMGSDLFYIRRYKRKDGTILHIVYEILSLVFSQKLRIGSKI